VELSYQTNFEKTHHLNTIPKIQRYYPTNFIHSATHVPYMPLNVITVHMSVGTTKYLKLP